MKWNWQKRGWPRFTYEKSAFADFEACFLRQSGIFLGALKHVSTEDKDALVVELMSTEAQKTSEIEGEILNRDSLQSSIRRNFGFDDKNRKIPPAEQGIAEMMVDLYKTFDQPLSHEQLFAWHRLLMKGRKDLHAVGAYRTHEDPMQVVSGPVHKPKVHFEAPPSKAMRREMTQFIQWLNDTAPGGKNPLPALTRAGIAHLHFVCIHPFEDGNGRIGRAIAEKALSQCLGQPTLIALSHTIQERRKIYYDSLEKNNKDIEITDWLVYFANTILEAQGYTQKLIDFLIEKSKLYEKIRGKMNARQEKVIARLFREGPAGFKGGLSAEKYISIAKTSRATATRDLQGLLEIGALQKTGERKYTRYSLRIK
jgi:Fic family protein